MDFIKKCKRTFGMSSSKQHSFKGEKEGPAPPPYEENSGNGQNAELLRLAATFSENGNQHKKVAAMCKVVKESTGLALFFHEPKSPLGRVHGDTECQRCNQQTLHALDVSKEARGQVQIERRTQDIIARLNGRCKKLDQFCKSLRRYLLGKPSFNISPRHPTLLKGEIAVKLCYNEIGYLNAFRLTFDIKVSLAWLVSTADNKAVCSMKGAQVSMDWGTPPPLLCMCLLLLTTSTSKKSTTLWNSEKSALLLTTMGFLKFSKKTLRLSSSKEDALDLEKNETVPPPYQNEQATVRSTTNASASAEADNAPARTEEPKRRHLVDVVKELSALADTFASEGKQKTVRALCKAVTESTGRELGLTSLDVCKAMSVVRDRILELIKALREAGRHGHLDHFREGVVSRLAGLSNEMDELSEMLREELVSVPPLERHSYDYQYKHRMRRKGDDVVRACQDEVRACQDEVRACQDKVRHMYAFRLQFDPSLMG